MRSLIWLCLVGFAFCVGYLVGQLDTRASDYMVSRSVRIDSERPIAWLMLEMGMGVLNDRDRIGSLLDGSESKGADQGKVTTTLTVDGQEQPGRTSALAAWRLIGFVLWDAYGSVERVTELGYRGRRIGIVDGASEGRVWVRVTVGPPLGDPRVQCAVLTFEANENGPDDFWGGGVFRRSTVIRLTCSAEIDLPGDRCRLM